MLNDSLFSSDSTEWGTPQDLYDYLDARFGFSLDPCATVQNHKAENYFTKEQDGLNKLWHPYGTVFMNPPYGEPEQPCKPKCKKKRCVERGYHIDKYVPGVKDWIAKAALEASKGAVVVCLLPARTDTVWFHGDCMRAREICFIKGRLQFEGAPTSAPFPSMLVIFRKWSGQKPTFTRLDSKDLVGEI